MLNRRELSFWKLLEIDEWERHEQAPRSPYIRHSCYDDCNTLLGANGSGCRISRQRSYDPGPCRDVESSGLPWFEPPASGPGPVTNKVRWPRVFGSPPAGTLALPPLKDGDGISDYDQLVGDYTNPILQPWAADVVKKFGEMSLAGVTYGNPSNQCWPEPPPFIYKQALVLIIQQPDTITMVYSGNMDVRRVRMNQPHKDTPALYGDLVGHYEGDTLVIDTIGIRTDRKYAMIDLFGTPYTKALHLVERYRVRDIRRREGRN